MKNLMQYTRQLHQRRINAFFFSGQTPSGQEQLPLAHIKRDQDRTRTLREMFADVEYDTDDERP